MPPVVPTLSNIELPGEKVVLFSNLFQSFSLSSGGNLSLVLDYLPNLSNACLSHFFAKREQVSGS